MLYSTGISSGVLQFHQSGVIGVLPTVQALTGSDTTSKIGNKKTALKVVEKRLPKIPYNSEKQPLSEGMVSNAEYFLVTCYCQNSKVGTFNELRY